MPDKDPRSSIVSTAETKKQEEKKERKIYGKIGCDPEFLMFYGNRNTDAGTMFRAFFKNNPLFHINSRGENGIKVKNAGEIGTENAMGEMRPEAASSPEELTEKIGKLISAMYDQMPFLDVTTLSIGRPAGGHIHLDMPQELMSDEKIKGRILKIMATLIMPILASEHRTCAASRYTQAHYGNAADVRYDIKGSTMCAEFRAFTSEWICRPEITMATLSYVSVIWNEAIKNHEKLTKENIIFKNQPQIEAIQKMLLSDYKLITDTMIREIAKLVRTFELYPQFKDECELILNPEKSYKMKEEVGWEMFKGWGFREKPLALTKRNVLSERKLKTRIKLINADLLGGTFTMPYNNDYNIELYAKALAERTAALQWQLKNEYFLYGLKKGIKGFCVSYAQKKEIFKIPENSTKEDVINGIKKMRKRFIDVKQRVNGTKINPKTGKTQRIDNEGILIGIPYDIRVEKNIKPLIEIVWLLEREQLKAIEENEIKFPTTEEIEKTTKKEEGPQKVENSDEFASGLGPANIEPTIEMNNAAPITREALWKATPERMMQREQQARIIIDEANI